ncbi:MAG: response regulator [Alphaproteobacteria bacterium]|nr:response regulator [Alphaproteobacteria bacterium]
MIHPEQIRAARAMLSLSQRQLAKKAGVSVATLNNIERGAQTDPKISTITAIQQALESRGVEFTNAYEGAGVLLKPMRNGDAGATVLIVDDSREDRLLYKNWLGKSAHKKYRVVEADNARSGYGAFIESHPDCIVLDFKMYGSDGFQMLAEMKKDHVRLPPIVFVTGLHNDVLKESAERQGVAAYLEKKNLTKERFHEAIERALA